MSADLVHLVRHGEVHNPDGILYGRLPGYALSERGRRMAAIAAGSLAGSPVSALVASPLQRTQESAAPWAAAFEIPLASDERVIEPWNVFEGKRVRRELRNPTNWRHFLVPSRPSWGEPYAQVRDRMLAGMRDAWDATPGGDVVIVSHQMPIEVVGRAIRGLPLAHNPRRRRTALSSITTFRRDESAPVGWVEVDYREPAAELLADAIDTGAV